MKPNYLERLVAYCQESSSWLLQAGFALETVSVGREGYVKYRRGNCVIAFDISKFQIPFAKLQRVMPAKFKQLIIRADIEVQSPKAMQFRKLRDQDKEKDWHNRIDGGEFDELARSALHELMTKLSEHIESPPWPLD